MYNQITSNKRRTVLLISVFVAILVFLGWIFGEYTGSGYSGIIAATLFSLLMTMVSYYAGDKLALVSSGAKEIKKEENPYLYRMVENLCITSGMPTPKIHIIEDLAINAFATGKDPEHSSIAVTRGALEKLQNEELEGVIAHELSHVKNYDIRLMMIVAVLVGSIALISDWMLRSSRFFHGGRNGRNNAGPALLILALLLAILTPIVATLIQLAVSRRREYLADASGALLTRFPEGLARALEKIKAESAKMSRANTATAHLFIANPFGASSLRSLLSTHPPIEERIKSLRQMA